MNILKKKIYNNQDNQISDFELFSLTNKNQFLECDVLSASKGFSLFVDSDSTADFLHKSKQTVFLRSGKYNNKTLLNHKLSKEHYKLQFDILFNFLEENKVQVLQGRLLDFSSTQKRSIQSTEFTKKFLKRSVVKRYFLISILGLIFKFPKKYLSVQKTRYPARYRRWETRMKLQNLSFFFIKKDSSLKISRPIILRNL